MGKAVTRSDAAKIVKSVLALETCPQFIAVEAADRIRRARIVTLIIDHFISHLAEAKTSAETVNIDCSSSLHDQLSTLQHEMLAGSLFARTRFFLFKNMDQCSASELKELVEVIKASPPDIKIIVSSQILAASSPLKKHFSQYGVVITLPDLTGFDLNRWTQKELKQQGVQSWSAEAVEQVISLAEEDPDRIAVVVEHLAMYLAEDAQLSAAEIDEVFIHQRDPSEFQLLDLLSKSEAWRIELLLSQLIRGGKNPFGLLGLIAKSFARNLALASLLERGMRPADIRQQLGITPWLYQKHAEAIKRYNIADLKRSLFAILRADAKLKNQSLGTEAIFSELAGRLST